jgi:Uma2 family endonuclease
MLSDATHTPEWPDLDDRLVEPETRYEMLDGELIYVSPADDAHGEQHVTIAALIEAHSGMEYRVAIDLLTRTSRTSDIAPDVSVYLRARHPETGKRQLAQVAFEIVSKQSLGYAGRKAASLVARGVRRVFGIDVERRRILEWSAELATWQVLDLSGQIDDPVFDIPLSFSELLITTKTDDAVQRALAAKRNPVFEAMKRTERDSGLREGQARALLAVLAARGLPVADADRDRILGEHDPERLDSWVASAVTCTSMAELLGEP